MGKKVTLDPKGTPSTTAMTRTEILVPTYMFEIVQKAGSGMKLGDGVSGPLSKAITNAGFGDKDLVAMALGGIFTLGFDLITAMGGPETANEFVQFVNGKAA